MRPYIFNYLITLDFFIAREVNDDLLRLPVPVFENLSISIFTIEKMANN